MRQDRDHEAHQAGEREAVEEDKAQDAAFAAITFRGCGGDHDALRRDHLAHDAAARVG